MSIIITNTNYNGEVLERILTVAATSNELVEKGLIHVIPGVSKSISIPRLRVGKVLQKRKENPQVEDGKGNFNYSENKLEPKDFMAFTTFNPRTFEQVWRKWQPKGNLVFSELPEEGQNALLEVLSTQLKFELGYHYINGTYGEGDDNLMNGILTQIAKDKNVVVVDKGSETTMLGKLRKLRAGIPKAMRNNPNLRILMSIEDFDTYDNELTTSSNKHADETVVNEKRYKGITIETLAAFPEGLLLATLCSPDSDGNLFAAVNLQDDEEVILIDRISPASELFFFKLLMKADTNIAFGEEVVVLDARQSPVFTVEADTLTASPTTLSFEAAGGTQEATVTATNEFIVAASPKGFDVVVTEQGISVTAPANEKATAVKGNIVLQLVGVPDKKFTIKVSQAAAQ